VAQSSSSVQTVAQTVPDPSQPYGAQSVLPTLQVPTPSQLPSVSVSSVQTLLVHAVPAA